MSYRCCLCDPAGEIREGRIIPTSGAVPLCAEHRAQSYWRSCQPAPPRVTVLPAPYEQVAMRAALVAPQSLPGISR